MCMHVHYFMGKIGVKLYIMSKNRMHFCVNSSHVQKMKQREIILCYFSCIVILILLGWEIKMGAMWKIYQVAYLSILLINISSLQCLPFKHFESYVVEVLQVLCEHRLLVVPSMCCACLTGQGEKFQALYYLSTFSLASFNCSSFCWVTFSSDLIFHKERKVLCIFFRSCFLRQGKL